MKGLAIVVCAGLLGLGAFVGVPDVAAQCQWGCRCVGDACGCSKTGNGSSCAASGDGCVVNGCSGGGDHQPHGVAFSADGAPVLLRDIEDRAADGAASLLASARWEEGEDGVRVARDCSGAVVARRYAAGLAAEIRRREGELTV